MTIRSPKIIATTLAALVAVSSFPIPSFAAPRGYCDAYARRVANHSANGGNVLAGTVLGVGAGALLGAAFGGLIAVGNGMIIGGVGGTVAGGVATDARWHRKYDRAFWDCRHNM